MGDRVTLAATIDTPLPPAPFMEAVGSTNGADFLEVGRRWFEMVHSHCAVTPMDRVLDIGSGCGRTAIHFTMFLHETTPYHGFDIVLPMVEWCKKNISERFPNFRFHHAQLANSFYSDQGQDASRYIFPYDDCYFDAAMAASVFTHLMPDAAKRYLYEIARVLKPGRKALLSFYLLNDELRRQRAAGETVAIAFPYEHENYALQEPDRPEAAIAFEEEFVRALVAAAGLGIDALAYGSWRKPGGWGFQDILVVSKSC